MLFIQPVPDCGVAGIGRTTCLGFETGDMSFSSKLIGGSGDSEVEDLEPKHENIVSITNNRKAAMS